MALKEHPDVLVKRCLKNEQSAWDDLVHRYAGEVKSHVIYIMKQYNCGHLIEEHIDKIILYIFEELYLNLPKYSFVNFAAWFSLLRRSKTLQYLKEELRFSDRNVQMGGAENVIPDKSRGPFQETFRGELLKKVDTLPPKYSEPIKFFYFHGLSYEEIGKLMGISTTNVGIRLSRGLKKLRKKIR